MSCDWSLQNDAAAHWKNLWRNKLHTVREHLLNYSLWCSVNLQGSNLPDLRMTKVSIYDWQHRSPTMKQERTWMRPRAPASIWKRKMSGIPRYSGNHQLDLLPPLRFKCQASSMLLNFLRTCTVWQDFPSSHRKISGRPSCNHSTDQSTSLQTVWTWFKYVQVLNMQHHATTFSLNMAKSGSMKLLCAVWSHLLNGRKQGGKIPNNLSKLLPFRREFPKYWGRKKLPTNSRDLWSTSVVVPIECHPCKEQPQPDRRHSRTTCQKSSATRQRNASQGQKRQSRLAAYPDVPNLWNICDYI